PRLPELGRLRHSQVTNGGGEPCCLRCKLRFKRGRMRRDDFSLLIWCGIIHPQQEATSAQSIRQFPLGIRRQHHNWPTLRDNGAELRNRNLEIRKNLQE